MGGGLTDLEKETELLWLGSECSYFPNKALSIQRQESGELQPDAAVTHSEGFHSWTCSELCVIEKVSKTKVIPLCKLSLLISSHNFCGFLQNRTRDSQTREKQ